MLATQTGMIRLAHPADMTAVVELMFALQQETHWRKFEMSAAHVEATIVRWLTESGQHALFIAEDDGALVGLCGGEITSNPFFPHVPFVQEWAWYVRPEYRQNGAGPALLRALYRWGKARGARGGVAARITAHGEEMRWTSF